MNLQTDSAQNTYSEVPMSGDQHVRLTHIATGWNGHPTIRVQIREETGHLRPGPEIPVAILGSLAAALIELLSQPTHQPTVAS